MLKMNWREVEHFKAKRQKDCCRNCGSPMYVVNHRFTPTEAWWISCDDCGIKGHEGPTRELAFEIWRKELPYEY